MDTATLPSLKESAGPDAILMRKPKRSAFSHSPFVRFLELNAINAIVLAGFHIDCCVRKTAQDALKLGMSVVTSPEILFTDSVGKLMPWISLGFFRQGNSTLFRSAEDVQLYLEALHRALSSVEHNPAAPVLCKPAAAGYS